MSKVRLMVTESKCRCGYLKAGDTFLVDDLCPADLPRIVEYDLSICICVKKRGFA